MNVFADGYVVVQRDEGAVFQLEPNDQVSLTRSTGDDLFSSVCWRRPSPLLRDAGRDFVKGSLFMTVWRFCSFNVLFSVNRSWLRTNPRSTYGKFCKRLVFSLFCWLVPVSTFGFEASFHSSLILKVNVVFDTSASQERAVVRHSF